MQDRYSGLSDRAIRNKTNPTKSEQELIDAQVNAIVEDFLNKVDAEPVFGKRVLYNLAKRLVPQEQEEPAWKRKLTELDHEEPSYGRLI